jgi:hypothetical protein
VASSISAGLPRLVLFNGVPTYPIVPDEISLGRAVGYNIGGLAGPLATELLKQLLRFEMIANFTHNFFKPFAITFDFTDMNLYITGESLTPGR